MPSSDPIPLTEMSRNVFATDTWASIRHAQVGDKSPELDPNPMGSLVANSFWLFIKLLLGCPFADETGTRGDGSVPEDNLLSDD